MSDIDKILEERGQVYGNFEGHARIAQNFKILLRGNGKWRYLDADMQESLDMIAHKMARILNGDCEYVDSWVDIAGYAQLVANRLGDKK